MSFTPGPWTVDTPGSPLEVRGANGETVIVWGELYDHSSWKPEDIRLIAAAPDLLAALKAMRDGAYGNPSCPEENAAVDAAADAAIAKAEGRAGAVEAA